MNAKINSHYDSIYKRLNPNNVSLISTALVKHFLALSGLSSDNIIKVLHETNAHQNTKFMDKNMIYDTFGRIAMLQSTHLKMTTPFKSDRLLPYFDLPSELDEREYHPTMDILKKFSNLFGLFKPTNGFLNEEDINKYFMSFGLDEPTINLIWSYIDADMDGKIDEIEFIVGSIIVHKLKIYKSFLKFLPTCLIRMIRIGPNEPPRDLSTYMNRNSKQNSDNIGRYSKSVISFDTSSNVNRKENVIPIKFDDNQVNNTELNVDIPKLRQLFAQLDITNENTLPLNAIKTFLYNTKLDKEILAKIWDVCGISNLSIINFDVFVKVVRLTNYYKTKLENSRKSSISSMVCPFGVNDAAASSTTETTTAITNKNVFTLNQTSQTQNDGRNINLKNTPFGDNNVFTTPNISNVENYFLNVISNLQVKFQELNNINQQRNDAILQTIGSLNSQLNMINSSISQYNHEMSNISNGINELKLDIENIKNERLNLVEHVNTMKNEILKYVVEIDQRLRNHCNANIPNIAQGKTLNVHSDVNSSNHLSQANPCIKSTMSSTFSVPSFNPTMSYDNLSLKTNQSHTTIHEMDDPFKTDIQSVSYHGQTQSNQQLGKIRGNSQLNQNLQNRSDSIANFTDNKYHLTKDVFGQEKSSIHHINSNSFRDDNSLFNGPFSNEIPNDPFNGAPYQSSFVPFAVSGSHQYDNAQNKLTGSNTFEHVIMGHSNFDNINSNYDGDDFDSQKSDPFKSANHSVNKFTYDIAKTNDQALTFHDPFGNSLKNVTGFNAELSYPSDNNIRPINERIDNDSFHGALTDPEQFHYSDADHDNISTIGGKNTPSDIKRSKPKKKGSIFNRSTNKKKKSTISE